MAEEKTAIRKISTTSTKQEMLDAYNELARQLEDQRTAEMKKYRAVKGAVEGSAAVKSLGGGQHFGGDAGGRP